MSLSPYRGYGQTLILSSNLFNKDSSKKTYEDLIAAINNSIWELENLRDIEGETDFIEAHILILKDPALKMMLDQKINQFKMDVYQAVEEAFALFSDTLSLTDNQYLKERILLDF